MRSKEIVGALIAPVLGTVLIELISTCSFPGGISRRVKEKANGYCSACGKKVGKNNLIAGHIIHGKENNKIKNAIAHCPCCEAEHHLKHAHDPQAIGLSVEDNDATTNGHIRRLNEEEAQKLISQYQGQWQGVLERLNKEK